MPDFCFILFVGRPTLAPSFLDSELPVKNVFGLNVIFSAFTLPVARTSYEDEGTFNPSPSDVSRARMLRRTIKRTDRDLDDRKAN